MKSIVYSALALVFTCSTVFGQESLLMTKNAKDYFIGAIISGKAYKETGTTKVLSTMKFNPVVSTSIPGVRSETIIPTLAGLQGYVQKAIASGSLGSGGGNFAGLQKLSNDAASVDAYFGIKDAAKVLFLDANVLKRYTLYATQTRTTWFDVIADGPSTATEVYLTKEEAARWKTEDPLIISAVTYGRKSALVIASNKSAALVTEAFSIFREKKTQEYAKANALLADALITVVAYGKNDLDTTGMSPQEIYAAYEKFVTRSITKEELAAPLFFYETKALLDN